MLTTTMDSIRRKNASFARDVEYIKETALDDEIDVRTEMADGQFRRETVEELVEAADMVKKLDDTEDPVQEATEIDRILNATENLTFEEMAGIE